MLAGAIAQQVEYSPLTTSDLLDRLAAHRALGSVPRAQLEWLLERSTLRIVRPGDELLPVDVPIRSLYVVLSGLLSIRVDRGAGPRRVMEWGPGDVTGYLPYSRLSLPPGHTVAEEDAEVLVMSADHFPEMVAKCHELTAALVHIMLDRARVFTKNDLHDEKLISLGRLSAGLAHELNNPASALARTAKELAGSLLGMEEGAFELGAARLTSEQRAAIGHVCARCEEADARSEPTPLERADREEAVTDWLDRRNIHGETATLLVETPLTVDALDYLDQALGDTLLPVALRSIGAGYRVRALTSQVETATARIHSLVAAVKGFTYMDQTNIPSPVDIGQGLADTIAVLRSKARAKSVTVTLDVPPDLPTVEGFGGELNQVWGNLIDNAIDAVPESGHVEVCAETRDGLVVVRVSDDGPGIPDEVRANVFEPFFTTKPMGQGTGLGLDIARRLVRQHEGHIEVSSRPGCTEFRVTLPRK